MALVALLLTHLAIFVPWPMRWRVLLILATFGSALLGEASSWLVRFVSPGWAILKVGSFVTLQTTLAILLVGLALMAAYLVAVGLTRVRSPVLFGKLLR